MPLLLEIGLRIFGLNLREYLAMYFFLMLMAVWIYAIVDIVRSKFQEDMQKIIWMLLVLLVPVVGTLLYYIIGQKQKEEENWELPDDLV